MRAGVGDHPRPENECVMLVSVIVPCFNYARYLRDAVNSIVGGPTSLGEFEPQTLRDFDIIIVDDASTDDTEAVALSLVGERVRYIKNETNVGTAAAVNAGIRQAAGEFITFLSADDMMESTRLEKLVATCRANPHRIAYDDIRVFGNGQRTDTWPMPDYDFDRILYKNTMHAGIVYPRQAWVDCGGYPEIMRDGREDWGINVALGAAGWCGIHVKEPLYLYRREGQNRSAQHTGREWRMTYLNRMQSIYPALYRGERTAMCCGNSSKKAASIQKSAGRFAGTNAAAQREAAMMQVGAVGMVLLEYQLPKAGHVIYTGSFTGQQYTFSSIRKRGYVDVRDAPTFLDRIEDRRHAFIQVFEAQPAANVATPPFKETEKAPPAPEPAKTEEIVITETVPQAPLPPKHKPRKSSA